MTPINRRTFLADAGMGLTGLALGSLLLRDGIGRAGAAQGSAPHQGPHFPARARSVIWLFLCGGVSQLESFDPKPELDRYDGLRFGQTPYASYLDPGRNEFALRLERNAETQPLMATQATFGRHGQCGMQVSDFFPQIARCADDIAV